MTKHIINAIVFIEIFFIYIYEIITLPIYIILQRPWIRLSKANAVRGRQLNHDNQYLPWVNSKTISKYFVNECKTVDEIIQKSIEIYGREKICLGYRKVIIEEIVVCEGKPLTKYVLSDYKWLTFGQFEQKVINIGKGLFIIGVKSDDKVMIFADTSIQWFICAQSLLRIGATVVTLYTSINDQGIIHCINETEVTHIITSDKLLPKLIRLKNKIPKMSTIVYFDTNYKRNDWAIKLYEETSTLNLISLSQLESKAKMSVSENILTVTCSNEMDLAFLLFTSGTTGFPKGVQITHKNVLQTLMSLGYLIKQIQSLVNNNKAYIANLPLAHVYELIYVHLFFINGFKIGFSSKNTLTDMGSAIRKGDKGDSTLLKPTVMGSMALVLDRFRKEINRRVNRKPIIVRNFFYFWVKYKYFLNKKGFDTPLMNRIFLQKFREIVGGKLSIILIGGSPLSPALHQFIKICFNVRILNGYAATETCCSGAKMDIYDESLGRVGAPEINTQVKLINWSEGGYKVTDKPNPRGEIVVGSESVSIGYYKLETKTDGVFYTDPDGRRWFVTGDIGEVFPNGTFKIIDRKKDLIKLQNGEYVALGKIESELKTNAFVDNICVFGHLYALYLVALIVPNLISVISLAKDLKVDYNSCTDLYENKRIVHFILTQIRRHGLKAGLYNCEIPRQIWLCPDEWTPDNCLLTAFMKNNRANISNKYKNQIDLMYKH